MKMGKWQAPLLLAVLSLSSVACSDIMRSLRQESLAIDAQAGRDREDGDEAVYAYKPKNLMGPSANNTRVVEPGVQRDYGRRLAGSSAGDSYEATAGQKAALEGRRYTREDFVDKQASENSLWDSQGQGNYLFSHNRRRDIGDLVTVDVERELKREIQYQLWLTLPPEQRKVRRSPASVAASTQEGAAGANAQKPAAPGAEANKSLEERGKDAAEEAAKTNMAATGKDEDNVRMEVVENLGNGLVRMVGQKRVIYRGQSRVVEVMAIVNNKDIDDQNRLKSGVILDMTTQVIQ